MDSPGPMVLFATPGMLHSGLSLDVFKKWAGNELNLVVIPGYCVVGTVGNKLLSGRTQSVEIDKKTVLDVKCTVANLSFSAHADAKGIMQLLRMAEPRAALLVHGEKNKMAFLKSRVMEELNIPCYDPPNGATVTIQTSPAIPVDMSRNLLKRALLASVPGDMPSPHHNGSVQGLVLVRGTKVRVVDPTEAGQQLGLAPHSLTLSTSIPFLSVPKHTTLAALGAAISQSLPNNLLTADNDAITLRSIRITLSSSNTLSIEWNWTDEVLVSHVISVARQITQEINNVNGI